MTALGTRSLKLTLDGQEQTAQVNKVTIDSADAGSDFTSFADAASGGARKYILKFTATQDPADPDSIWSQVWDHAGETVTAEVLPYGGTVVSASNPAFRGNVKITEPDGTILGGEADASNTAKFTMELEWEFEAKPERITAP
jgi:hypothetical protein